MTCTKGKNPSLGHMQSRCHLNDREEALYQLARLLCVPARFRPFEPWGECVCIYKRINWPSVYTFDRTLHCLARGGILRVRQWTSRFKKNFSIFFFFFHQRCQRFKFARTDPRCVVRVRFIAEMVCGSLKKYVYKQVRGVGLNYGRVCKKKKKKTHRGLYVDRFMPDLCARIYTHRKIVWRKRYTSDQTGFSQTNDPESCFKS